MQRDNTALIASIKQHEGYDNEVYRDTEGNPTIGYGHLIQQEELEDFNEMGIEEEQAEKYLLQDIAEAQANAESYQFFSKMDPARQDVMIEMIFNMGLTKFSLFDKTIKGMRKGAEGDSRGYEQASHEMLWNSPSYQKTPWHSQVKGRAQTLSDRMKGGTR